VPGASRRSTLSRGQVLPLRLLSAMMADRLIKQSPKQLAALSRQDMDLREARAPDSGYRGQCVACNGPIDRENLRWTSPWVKPEWTVFCSKECAESARLHPAHAWLRRRSVNRPGGLCRLCGLEIPADRRRSFYCTKEHATAARYELRLSELPLFDGDVAEDKRCARCGTRRLTVRQRVYCRLCAAAKRRERNRARMRRKYAAQRSPAQQPCSVCGKRFQPTRAGHHVCSTRCRVAAHRAREVTPPAAAASRASSAAGVARPARPARAPSVDRHRVPRTRRRR
jgi:hypothetical protein